MPRDVFVLGAGFTCAFLPKTPLLVDHYDLTVECAGLTLGSS